MSRPIRQIDLELPGYILKRRQWIDSMECWHQEEADTRMGIVPYLAVLGIVLGIVLTACLVVWMIP